MRSEEDYPLAVIHIAPQLAFSKAATRFSVPDLLERGVRLHSGSPRPTRPDMMPGGVESTTDPAPQHGEGGRKISLYENAVVEIITARATYTKTDETIISHNSLVDSITGNLATVLSLLAERHQDQNVLVTATYVGFDGSKLKIDFPTSPVTHNHVQTPVLSFPSHNPENGEDADTYNLREERVKELFRPLFHSVDRKDFPMEIPGSLGLPDLSVDES
ncbi:hypothetical protein [Halorubrum sp. DM2]|uniref:hypothetical protein n=1 Tax=Halorubrum sp. DM2 TaxID=2527867 RepID=UPI0024B6A606|nr:hypothetical protein [Halorubrum sp. DM2]